jgi:hypothetical protein
MPARARKPSFISSPGTVKIAREPTRRDAVSTTLVAVALSVLAHGTSAAPLVRRYVAWSEGHRRDAMPEMEGVPAPPHRWRHTAGSQPASALHETGEC